MAVKKYPKNRMLGWREFVDAKVFHGNFIMCSRFQVQKNKGI